MNLLKDGDYKINNSGSIWVEVRGFVVHLQTTDEGIIVDVFNAEEIRSQPFTEPLASTYAFDNELA